MTTFNKQSYVTYTKVEDLNLSAEIISDIDFNGDIQIDIDTELCATSTNPVENRVILSALDTKLNRDMYKIDSELDSESANPVQNKAISKTVDGLVSRISQLELLNSLKLTYVTNLEVFPTLTDIAAGDKSEKIALTNRMFKDTNRWNLTKRYPAETIVTDNVKIYKSTQEVPAGTELTAVNESDDTKYWNDITDTYLYKDSETGEYYHRFITSVPKSAIQVLKFKSVVDPTMQTVSINWGDSETSFTLFNAEEKTNDVVLGAEHPIVYEKDANGYIYSCWHDYTDALTTENATSKYYTITILGNKFSTLTADKDNNIISNIFGNNQQFQMDCFDCEGLLAGSKKILYIDCSDYNNIILQLFNTKSMFEGCENLQYAIGFYELTGINTMLSMERMFADCINLLNSDIRIAKSMAVDNIDNGNTEVYLNCKNMSSSLRLLLPSNGFDSRIITLNSTFKNCKNIHLNSSNDAGEPSNLDHVSNILFNDNSKLFNIDKPFENCQLIASSIPNETSNANGYWK